MGFFEYFLMLALMFVGVVLMFIVLLQRGRGGGLAGAFGGQGGQSAFGTKAGDVFTKITVGIAVVWVLLAGFSGIMIRNTAGKGRGDFGGDRAAEVPAVKPAEPSTDKTATDKAATDKSATDKPAPAGEGTKSGTGTKTEGATPPKSGTPDKSAAPAKTDVPASKPDSQPPKSGTEPEGAAKPDGGGSAAPEKSEK